MGKNSIIKINVLQLCHRKGGPGLVHVRLININQVLCCKTGKSAVSVALHVGSVQCCVNYIKGALPSILYFHLVRF